MIGWYIPAYLLKQYPAFKTWKGLKGKESVFKSPESGSQGMFLGGDPSYVQKDRALIKDLGLNLKHVVAGAEPAQVARWTQLYKQKKPVLFYWYDPQYLNATYKLVQHPAADALRRLRGRREEGRRSEEVRVRVPLVRARQGRERQVRDERLAGHQGGQRFNWTSADQNYVANLISGKKLEKDKAAEMWVKTNAKRSAPG